MECQANLGEIMIASVLFPSFSQILPPPSRAYLPYNMSIRVMIIWFGVDDVVLKINFTPRGEHFSLFPNNSLGKGFPLSSAKLMLNSIFPFMDVCI